jgi:hypothetical protein
MIRKESGYRVITQQKIPVLKWTSGIDKKKKGNSTVYKKVFGLIGKE